MMDSFLDGRAKRPLCEEFHPETMQTGHNSYHAVPRSTRSLAQRRETRRTKKQTCWPKSVAFGSESNETIANDKMRESEFSYVCLISMWTDQCRRSLSFGAASASVSASQRNTRRKFFSKRAWGNSFRRASTLRDAAGANSERRRHSSDHRSRPRTASATITNKIRQDILHYSSSIVNSCWQAQPCPRQAERTRRSSRTRERTLRDAESEGIARPSRILPACASAAGAAFFRFYRSSLRLRIANDVAPVRAPMG